jgi:hypothetical protein
MSVDSTDDEGDAVVEVVASVVDCCSACVEVVDSVDVDSDDVVLVIVVVVCSGVVDVEEVDVSVLLDVSTVKITGWGVVTLAVFVIGCVREMVGRIVAIVMRAVVGFVR